MVEIKFEVSYQDKANEAFVTVLSSNVIGGNTFYLKYWKGLSGIFILYSAIYLEGIDGDQEDDLLEVF